MFAPYPLLILTLMCACATAQAEPQTSEMPGITLHADPAGHFSGTVLINQYSMPFIIDTGATVTTIPMNLAVAARLSLGQQVETSTANGRSFAKSTRIESLKLGSAEIKNVEAHVNQHLTQVLIGMNTLKYFTLNQTADTMTLAINQQMLKDGKLDAGVSVGTAGQADTAHEQALPGGKPSKPIKKSKSCDLTNHCVTRYGN